MANPVWVTQQGYHYTAALPLNPSDMQLPFPDPDYVAVLTGIPTKPESPRATMIANKVSAGKLDKNKTGWISAALIVLGLFFAAPQEAKAQATPAHAGSTASNNATSVALGPGALWDFQAVNTTATVYYVRFYDVAGAPTCSSATGVITNFPVPASTTGNGITVVFPVGKGYSNGLSFCITGGSADNDNTNAATGVTINFDYGNNMRP